MHQLDTHALLDEIRRWVEIETPTRAAAAVNTLVDLVASRMREAGLLVERIPGVDGLGDILIGRSHPQTDGGLLISGHLDTVHPQGTLSNALPWRMEGDRAYGPGVYDMKASCVIALEAWRLLRAQGRMPLVPITFLFVPDEEIGSPSSRAITEREARRAMATFVVEPARDGGKIVIGRKGIAMFKISTRGRAAHAGSYFTKGRNAITEMAAQISRLNALTDLNAGVTVNVGTIHGGIGRNTVPDFCEIEVDVRASDAGQMERVVSAIRGLTAIGEGIALMIDGHVSRPPFHPDTSSEILFRHARSIAGALDIDLQGLIVGGGSDGNFTAAVGCPTLDGLGCDGANAHTLEEHILISSLVPRTRLLAELFARTGQSALDI